jgi:hypothetical protein
MTTWRKSSHSQNDSVCVEVASTLTRVRDSKNTQGPTLRADVAALVHAIKAGHVNRC